MRKPRKPKPKAKPLTPRLTPQQKELFEKVTADIEAMDWQASAVNGPTEDWDHDGPRLKTILLEAIANALAYEDRHGFQIANIATVDLPGAGLLWGGRLTNPGLSDQLDLGHGVVKAIYLNSRLSGPAS